MKTTKLVRDAVVHEKLFGYDVQSIMVEEHKYYIMSSVFTHFGQVASMSTRAEYCHRFQGLYSWVITWARLKAYCHKTMLQDRVRKKTELMKHIRDNDEPLAELPKPGVNDGLLKVPDTVTVEAQQLKALVSGLGIGRVHTILQELGLIPQLCSEPTSTKQPPRKIVVTIEY